MWDRTQESVNPRQILEPLSKRSFGADFLAKTHMESWHIDCGQFINAGHKSPNDQPSEPN